MNLKEFDRLFNIFTVAAIVVMLITTVAAASFTVIVRGDNNIFSAKSTQNTSQNAEKFVSAL